jgi:hypothetical protein
LCLQDRIEELDGLVSKLKRDAKKYKDKEAAVSTELEETKSDLSKTFTSRCIFCLYWTLCNRSR